MTLTIRVISCVVAFIAATALFVVGLFVQSGIEATSGSPIVLFGLSIALFMVANYYGLLIRDHCIASAKLRHRTPRRIR